MARNSVVDLVLVPVETGLKGDLPELAAGCSSCTAGASAPRPAAQK